MKYQLHDADRELWAWVKQGAYLAGLSINDYILSILMQLKNEQPRSNTRKYMWVKKYRETH